MTSSYRFDFMLGHAKYWATWHNGSLTVGPNTARRYLGIDTLQARVPTIEDAYRLLRTLGAKAHDLRTSQRVQA